MPTRDGYYRAVFVQEATGFCVDIPGHLMLLGATPSMDEKTMSVNGSSRPVSRVYKLDLKIIDECHISALRDMCAINERVTMYIIGLKRHQVWSVPEKLDVVDRRGGSGSMAGARVHLQSHAFHAGIFQSDNILEGFPWSCTESRVIAGSAASGSGQLYGSGSGVFDNNFWLLPEGQQDFVGPYWNPGAAGASVDISGKLTKADGIDPELDWILPIQGATITLEDADVAMTVFFHDWSGSIIGSQTKALGTDSLNVLVPDGTWRVVFSVDEADAPPRVTIASAGQSLDPRGGRDKIGVRSFVGIPEWST